MCRPWCQRSTPVSTSSSFLEVWLPVLKADRGMVRPPDLGSGCSRAAFMPQPLVPAWVGLQLCLHLPSSPWSCPWPADLTSSLGFRPTLPVPRSELYRERGLGSKTKNPNLQNSYTLELQRGLTVCTWAQLWMDSTSSRVTDQSLCVFHLRQPYRETLCRRTQLSLLKCTWTVHRKCFGNENCKNKQTNKGKARQVI